MEANESKAPLKEGRWVVVNEQGEYLYVASDIQDGLLWIDSFAAHGDIWELIQHTSPCAQCPNVGHKTCCCEVR